MTYQISVKLAEMQWLCVAVIDDVVPIATLIPLCRELEQHFAGVALFRVSDDDTIVEEMPSALWRDLPMMTA